MKFDKSKDPFTSHINKMNRYLDLTEQALEEVFKLNGNFLSLSNSLY